MFSIPMKQENKILGGIKMNEITLYASNVRGLASNTKYNRKITIQILKRLERLYQLIMYLVIKTILGTLKLYKF